MLDPIEVAAIDIRAVRLAHGLVGDLAPSDLDRTDAWRLLANLHTAGWRIVRPAETDPHYVVFKDDGWEIEHSAACRNSGSMLDCRLHRELTDYCDGPPPQGVGRYEAEELEHGWDITPAADAVRPTALLYVDEWTPLADAGERT